MSGEFASKGVAGSGLGLGIAGTALGVLNSSCNGGGLLGGLFGNGCQMNQVSALQSEISQLKAEKYSDQSIANVYTALRNETQAVFARAHYFRFYVRALFHLENLFRVCACV